LVVEVCVWEEAEVLSFSGAKFRILYNKLISETWCGIQKNCMLDDSYI
jgi:hypothetical protein